jgi:alkaline phosphatase
VPTLLEWAKAAGWATGVVTTTRVTHATPAATFSHVSDRDDEQEIARQLVPGGLGSNSTLGDGLQVVFGGGRSQFTSRADKRNLVDELKAKGYGYVSNGTELDALPLQGPAQKVLGLFTNSHMPYELDRKPGVEPSLAEMSRKAVQILAQNPKGYFLMVEGGRIDHALHDTNAKRALVDTIAFDDAIRAVLDEVRKTDPNLANTLIVVTADHDHTMVHQGYAQRTGKTAPGNAGVLGLVKSYAGANEGKPSLDADGMPYTILAFGNGPNRVRGSRVNAPLLSDEFVGADDYLQEAAIRMPSGSETHGGTDVAIQAIGFGADTFHGFMDNTEVFGKLRALTKL